MSSTQEFRRRIKSVNNIRQITKAMEMIASIKMQKAVKNITLARAYIQNAWNILHMISKKALPEDHELVKPHDNINKTAVILITSDRGLCGSYNAEVIKKLVNYCSSEARTKNGLDFSADASKNNIDIVAVGKVGAGYVNRYNLGNLVAEFKGFENNISVEDVVPISKMTVGEYLENKYDKVVLIYSHFLSSIKQIPVAQQILPIVENHIDNQEIWEKDRHDATASRDDNSVIASEAKQSMTGTQSLSIQNDSDTKFEPSPEAVVDGVLKQILRTQIYGAVLEANASEHSARMVAMKNSTDSATDLVDELTLIYNSIRQSNITTEIAEISAAAEAMK